MIPQYSMSKLIEDQTINFSIDKSRKEFTASLNGDSIHVRVEGFSKMGEAEYFLCEVYDFLKNKGKIK